MRYLIITEIYTTNYQRVKTKFIVNLIASNDNSNDLVNNNSLWCQGVLYPEASPGSSPFPNQISLQCSRLLVRCGSPVLSLFVGC